MTDFIALLTKEYEQYCRLKEKAELKQKAIIENDIEKLATIVAEEQELINLIDNLEVERQDYLVRIAEENKLKGKHISFNILVDLLPAEKKKELQVLRQDFLEVLTELQQINETNRLLIQDSLQINKFSLELIRQVVGKDTTYSKPGKNKIKSEHLIDRKA